MSWCCCKPVTEVEPVIPEAAKPGHLAGLQQGLAVDRKIQEARLRRYVPIGDSGGPLAPSQPAAGHRNDRCENRTG